MFCPFLPTTYAEAAKGQNTEEVAVRLVYCGPSTGDIGFGVVAGGHGWPAGARHYRHNHSAEHCGGGAVTVHKERALFKTINYLLRASCPCPWCG